MHVFHISSTVQQGTIHIYEINSDKPKRLISLRISHIIEINSLENYFSEKFCKATSEAELTVHASKKVADKYNSIKNNI